jgi:hypothetical protein
MPNARKYSEVRSREHLLSEEVEAMREAIKKRGGRHAHRDATLLLVIYRHGLRVEEAANLRWEQVDFATGTMHVRRVKRGRLRRSRSGGRSCDRCGGFSASIQCRRLCFSRVARGRWRMIRSRGLWSRRENWRVCRFLRIHTCCGMGRGTIWRTKG